MVEMIIKNGAKLATGVGISMMTTTLREMLTPENAGKVAKAAIFTTDVIVSCMVVDMVGDYIDEQVNGAKEFINEVKETRRKAKEEKEDPIEEVIEVEEVETIEEEVNEEKPKKATKKTK
jgi:hypothetical protein